ncbi:hypothetical protein Tsp_15910 [Trichinella spiralis]|uniref:hypothetical protein n=1 Tax=Trichinella spiralis TaxID=6334 RepID=UPI0001EFD6B9|nr:hypothetical protein Tsp_15910 [Trichinella spiralis]
MIIFILRATLFIGKSGWVPAKTASSGMSLVNPFVSSIGGEAHDDGFSFVLTHVALVITSLPRMLASITYALNERRNQNGNSGSKLLRTVDDLSCDRTCNRLNVADVSQGEDPQLLIFQFLWHNHMDEPHKDRCFSIF